MKTRLLSPAVLILMSGCGALFNSGPANVAFSSNPAGAQVWIDGTNRGNTPVTLPLAKNRNYTVTYKLAGHEDATMEITKKVSGTYVILDILGGVLPIVVDAATGSWYTLSTNNVNMNLRPGASAAGQLTPEQLGAVRLGVSANTFIDADAVIAQMR